MARRHLPGLLMILAYPAISRHIRFRDGSQARNPSSVSREFRDVGGGWGDPGIDSELDWVAPSLIVLNTCRLAEASRIIELLQTSKSRGNRTLYSTK